MVKVKDALKDWVLAPKMIAVACRVMSRLVRGRSTILGRKLTTDKLFVLANGPSLHKDLERFGESMQNADRMVVNFMANTLEFAQVRPTVYVMSDPAFFCAQAAAPEVLRPKIDILRDALQKVNWPLTLILPDTARDSELVQIVSSNENLSFSYFWRGVPCPENIRDFEGWMKNRYAPPGQNVINTAIYLGIVWRYREIVLIGADTSFHTMLRIDQTTNKPYIFDEHFYGKDKQRRYLYKDNAQTIPQKLSEQFESIATAFRWYDKLREFADWAGVKIVNASSFSWIDAFERPKA